MHGITLTLDELLALRYKANQLSLPEQRMTNSFGLGNYQSTFRGRGMDFVETRAYQPGDDIRTINWAVTARTGKPHTKIYQQERERPVYLIIDFSPSMYFGTRKSFKSVAAVEAATLIAWAALKNGDKIGALLLKDKFQIISPSHRKQNIVELFKHLVDFVRPEKQGPIDYSTSFGKLRKTIRSGSLIYFLSDFYQFENELQQELKKIATNNILTNILVYDPLEKNPPKGGRYLFHDNLKPESLLVDTNNRSLCREYSNLFEERLFDLKKFCFSTGMYLAELSTNDDILKVMRQVLSRKV